VRNIIIEQNGSCINNEAEEIAESLIALWNENYFVTADNADDETAQKDLFNELFTELVEEKIEFIETN